MNTHKNGWHKKLQSMEKNEKLVERNRIHRETKTDEGEDRIWREDKADKRYEYINIKAKRRGIYKEVKEDGGGTR